MNKLCVGAARRLTAEDLAVAAAALGVDVATILAVWGASRRGDPPRRWNRGAAL